MLKLLFTNPGQRLVSEKLGLHVDYTASFLVEYVVSVVMGQNMVDVDVDADTDDCGYCTC